VVRVARPRDELVLHLDAGELGEVLVELDQALAGSQAAQHIVSDFPSACADDAAQRVNASVPAAHARDRFVLLILIVRSSDFGRSLPAVTKQSRWPRFQSARC
jgi:hypothetical protein